MMEKKNAPAIRFSEFTDEWKEQKFSRLYEPNNERNSGEFTFEKTISIASMTYNKKGNGADISSLSNYKVLRMGDIAYEGHTNKEFRYGRFVLNDLGDGIMSPRFTSLRPIAMQDFSFWKYYIHSEKVMRSKLVYATKAGTMMNELVYDDLAKLSIAVPSIDEQQKIGDFLENLDSFISSHQDRYEKLQSIKKAMLEKMFPHDGASVPEVRFNGFAGEWTLKKMDDVVSPYLDPVPTPHDGYWRLGIRSHAKGVFHDYVKPGMELETAKMHRVAANNFIVNITFGWEHAVAITSEEDAGMLVSHRFPQFSFNQDMVPEFFNYVIADEKFRRHLELASPGGAGRNRVLNIPQMLEYKMYVPSRPEQERIAGFFLELDSLISLQQQRLEKLKNIKAACLEGMFV